MTTIDVTTHIPPPAPPPKKTFDLVVRGLSREQAEDLVDLFGSVSGNERTTTRALTDSISDKLLNALGFKSFDKFFQRFKGDSIGRGTYTFKRSTPQS